MKICLINSLYDPYYRGGAEVVAEKIVKELLAENHQVMVITLGKKPNVTIQGNLSIFHLKPFNLFSFIDINDRSVWLRLLWHPLDVFNFSSYHSVKNILMSQKPDLVLTHNLKGLGYLIPKAIRHCRIKHFHTLHDVQLSRPSGLIIFGQEKPFLIIDKIYEKICRALFGSPDAVISPSQWLLTYHKKRGFFPASATKVLPNPVTFLKTALPPQKKFEGQNLIDFLYVGQVKSYKGIFLLLLACKLLKSDNWRLTIVGDGPDLLRAKALAGDDSHYRFVGRVKPEELINYYRASDLTVVPSLCYENSPTVIYESLVANVPVVASDIGGIGELIKDDYNGFTFAANKADNLAEVLEHFLEHPANLEKLKANCFVSVHNYSVANYCKQLLAL